MVISVRAYCNLRTKLDDDDGYYHTLVWTDKELLLHELDCWYDEAFVKVQSVDTL